MKTVVEGLERFAIHQGWNGIECDRCGKRLALDRTSFMEAALNEARGYGWVCEGAPRIDLCPLCVIGRSS